MEELTRELLTDIKEERKSTAAKSAAVLGDLIILLPEIGLMLFSCLLGSFTPFEGLSPFGSACILAAWYSGMNPYFACVGASVGYLLSGSYANGIACILMGVGIFLINSRSKPRRVIRLLFAFLMECVLNLLTALIFRKNPILAAGSATVSVFCSVVISSGLHGLKSIIGGRQASDAEYLTLCSVAGLVTLSMRTFSVAGISPGVVFACLCVLFASYRLGVPSVAAAVALGAGRVLATGSDMHFIAVIAAAALVSASFRALGKWGALVGFAGFSAAVTSIVRGNGVIGYPECIAACVVFAVVPARLYMPETVRHEIKTSSRTDPKLSRLQFRVASLSDVLKELARVCGGEDGKLLSYISGTLRSALNASSAAQPKLGFDCGKAESRKSGSFSSGDSALVRELDGKLLIAISDGMGSGEEAKRESRSALALLSDLLSVGFGLEDAASFVNRLLIGRSVGDMYATLDIMLTDLSDGSALIKKHGAPASYIIRGGRAYSVTSESLPVGIIGAVRGDVTRVRLQDGDTVVMTSDGVEEALGDDTAELSKRIVGDIPNMEKAAERLLDAALERGGDDDMTVIIARITRSSR